MKVCWMTILLFWLLQGIQAQTLPTDSGSSPADNLWDIPFSFTTANGGEVAVETDGVYLYTVKWTGNSYVNRYTISGQKLDSFLIPGISGVTDLAYDGQYFYGARNGSEIFKYDFTNHTSLGQISSFVAGARHISYDPTLDGGNGGFWVGAWVSGTLYAVSMTGATLFNVPAFNLYGPYGSAYDSYSPGGPYLWFFDQGAGMNTPQLIYQFSITTLSFTGVTHDVSDVPGFDTTNAIAGGLCSSPSLIPHKFTLIGSIQQNHNIIFSYEFDTIPVYHRDAGISRIITPSNSGTLTQHETISMMVHNYGAQTIVGIQTYYSINNGNPVNQVINTPILPGDSLLYTFSVKANLSGPGNYRIKTYIDVNGDEYPANDVAEKLIIGRNLTGSVTYMNPASTPLKNVQVNLLDESIWQVTQTTVTDSLGRYSFCVQDTGHYMISVSSQLPAGGYNALDALTILKYFTGMISLNPLQILAGDVDGSGGINAVDAMLIVRRFVGSIQSFDAGNWVFETAELNMPDIDPKVVDFKGLCVGDVNGSYVIP